ncbi:hypothetical protein DERP_001358 [Dermatophagoides pteronyssinus]|uniref:Uncharacterized protein n=1 Tax=Dermatophagoides pteronyssinus TaxID=6956 RepID=A0ABQ8JE72_DERPT|nr:hypothetical protein DERP_001358 [Dermatophagoides pteronyssinus]
MINIVLIVRAIHRIQKNNKMDKKPAMVNRVLVGSMFTYSTESVSINFALMSFYLSFLTNTDQTYLHVYNIKDYQ